MNYLNEMDFVSPFNCWLDNNDDLKNFVWGLNSVSLELLLALGDSQEQKQQKQPPNQILLIISTECTVKLHLNAFICSSVYKAIGFD